MFVCCFGVLFFSVNGPLLFFLFQSITGAMNNFKPPVPVGNPANQFRLDYIQQVASQSDFDYPPVRRTVCSVDAFDLVGLQFSVEEELEFIF